MNGLNIKVKDWQFIHRARLNAYADPMCNNCCHPETLPHVICHCRPCMTQIRDRHNKIVKQA